jgi:hypothetical protein
MQKKLGLKTRKSVAEMKGLGKDVFGRPCQMQADTARRMGII